MKERYPKQNLKISLEDNGIEQRFYKAALGWIKYKPLLLYITNRETYKTKIEDMVKKLQEIVPKLNDIFNDDCFSVLLEELEKYDKNVEQHYKDYLSGEITFL